MGLEDVDWMANHVDPVLVWVYTVCPELSAQNRALVIHVPLIIVAFQIHKHELLQNNWLPKFLFMLRFYGPVNSYGHVKPVSYPLTLFLGRLRPTKRLTST